MMRDGSGGGEELAGVETQGVSVVWKVAGSACSGPGGGVSSSSDVGGDVEILSVGSGIADVSSCGVV